MTLTDHLIAVRDATIDAILGTRRTPVLNPSTTVQTSGDSMDVVTEMRRAVSRFKAEAMDESGHRVDYALLRESDAYRECRSTWYPSSGAGIRSTATLFSRGTN